MRSDGPSPLDSLAEEFVERVRRGERPSLDEYASKFPELADSIRELFPGGVRPPTWMKRGPL